MDYYLFQNEETKGPYTLSQLRSMWHAGSITGETHFCVVGSDTWQRLKVMIDELEPKPISPPQAPPIQEFKANTKQSDDTCQRAKLISELRQTIEQSGERWISCPKCECPATGTRGCLGVLFFPISLLIMKPTYTCHACGFRFKQ